jgi:hypothetical protein
MLPINQWGNETVLMALRRLNQDADLLKEADSKN